MRKLYEIQISVFKNTTFTGTKPCYLFMYCLWFAAHYNNGIKSQQRPHALQNLKYLPSGHFKNVVDPVH